MTFTRRRWDAWCLGGALFLALGGVADMLYLSGKPWSALVFPVPMVALFLLRFRIPAAGFESTPIRRMSTAKRRLIAWGVATLPLLFVAAILAPRNLDAWWIYAVVAAAHMAVTLWLAHRADSPSIPEP